MKSSEVEFPKNFLWGVSSSAHQVEGGLHNQWTVWELENAKSLAARASYQYGDLPHWNEVKKQAKSPSNYVSGQGIDHYNLYRNDFELARRMHMNAWRFSIEWSRVEPQENAWNIEAIEHYRQYIKDLKSLGIEPIVTLFHFTLPVWFSALGGFEKRSNVKYFVRYAEKIIKELGVSVRYVITLNEPEVYAYYSYYTAEWPPQKSSKKALWSVLGNLAYAHNKSADAIHTLNRRYKVSIAKNSVYTYPGDDAQVTIKSAGIRQFFQDDYFLGKVVKKCDYLGVNYYFSDRMYGYRVHNPNDRISDLGWDLSPGHLQYVLERLHARYKLPILITENGLADEDDEYRKWWLMQTLIAMQKAISEGVDLIGYLHWTLVDNFEWDKGYWPKFGLFSVDRKTGKRSPRPSALWYARVIAKLRSSK